MVGAAASETSEVWKTFPWPPDGPVAEDGRVVLDWFLGTCGNPAVRKDVFCLGSCSVGKQWINEASVKHTVAIWRTR